MDIIHKYIPKNPINSATQEKMKNRIKEVLEKFCKNYASQTQLVIVKNKEDEIKKKEIRKSIVDADKEKKKNIIRKRMVKKQKFLIFLRFQKKEHLLK